MFTYIILVLILKNSFKDKMARSEGFYMTLPSDGSHQSFPDNKLSDFKTLLPTTIDLTDGEWEMALTELIFDHSVRNITPEEAHFDVAYEAAMQGYVNDPDPFKTGRFTLEKVANGKLNELFTLVEWENSYYNDNYKKLLLDEKRMPHDSLPIKVVRIQFRPGSYATAKALIKEINYAIRTAFHDVWNFYVSPNPGNKGQDTHEEHREEEHLDNVIHFVYDNVYDRVIYQIDGSVLRTKNLMCVRFPISLAYKLGFGGKAFFSKDDPDVVKFLKKAFQEGRHLDEDELEFKVTRWLNVNYLAPNSIDLYENLRQMYIYCDIVESQIVGSNALKLLRVIPVSTAADIETNQDKQAKWEPVRAEYLKLSKKHFDTIEIQIRNVLGQLYPFLRGKTVVKLHFRKVY